MGKFFDKCSKYAIEHEPPREYYIGHPWRCAFHVFPIFLLFFVFFTLLFYAPSPLADRIEGIISFIVTGRYSVSPPSTLIGSIIGGLILSLAISGWLGVRRYKGKFVSLRDPEIEEIGKKMDNEIKNKQYLWLPTPEEVEAGIVSPWEYQMRMDVCEKVKKRGISFRFLSTSELPPEDRAAILGNASGITPEKSPEIKPPEPKPIPPETKELR